MKRYLFLAVCSLFFLQANSQSEEDTIVTYPKYIEIGAGLTTGSLRDMSTSPLFYTGFLPAVNIAYNNYFNKNIIKLDLYSYNGIYLRSTENDYYSSSANMINFEISYYRNYKYKEYENFQHWPGFSINNYTTLRINNSFGNAAFALENISSINLNYMLNKRFTRKAKDKKFLWLIKYKRKEKNYLLSLKAGAPIFSLIYRPGYTNPGNATLNETLLPGYEFSNKVFPGMNTNVSLSRVLKNGNMFKMSYQWDFFTSGKYSLNRLDYSKHTVLFSLVFNIK